MENRIQDTSFHKVQKNIDETKRNETTCEEDAKGIENISILWHRYVH